MTSMRKALDKALSHYEKKEYAEAERGYRKYLRITHPSVHPILKHRIEIDPY